MLDKNIMSSFGWKFLERIGTQIINLVLQIVLARLITPEEFGSLAVLIVFVNIANIFIQKGLTSSIIRKKEIDELDYNTAFLASEFMSIILYIIIYFIAPFIAFKYKSIILIKGLRVFSIQLFFGALYCIQNAILIREMKFKVIFIRGIISSIIAGTIGIIMAYLNFGLWALVVQTLLTQILYCATAWYSISWKPRLSFSFERLKDILNFGGKILLSELLNYSVEGIKSLIIGKNYSTEALSYYDRGQIYPATLMRGIYDTLGGVLLPAFSKQQSDDEILSESVILSISLTMFLTTPIFIGMAAIAKPLTIILLTDKWIKSVPFFIIFCIYWIPYPVQGICKNGIYAKGNSSIILKIEIIKIIISLIALIISLKIGILAIAISSIIIMFLVSILYAIALKNIIRISLVSVFNSIIKSLISSSIMGIVVINLNLLGINIIFRMLIQIIIGITIYLLCSLIFKDKNLNILLSLIKNKMLKNIN